MSKYVRMHEMREQLSAVRRRVENSIPFMPPEHAHRLKSTLSGLDKLGSMMLKAQRIKAIDPQHIDWWVLWKRDGLSFRQIMAHPSATKEWGGAYTHEHIRRTIYRVDERLRAGDQPEALHTQALVKEILEND